MTHAENILFLLINLFLHVVAAIARAQSEVEGRWKKHGSYTQTQEGGVDLSGR